MDEPAVLGFTQPHISWNPVTDLRQLLAYPFMVNAVVAGTVVAVMAATIGWFMVLRRQTFAGHTLAVVGFPGAAAATLAGVSVVAGSFTSCIAAALVIAAVPRARRGGTSEESAVIGTTQAFALACGYLFVTLYTGNIGDVDSLLFGDFLGVTTGQIAVLGAAAALALMVLAVIGRPLLFATVDPEAADASGVPVGVLSVVFLVLVGIAAAETSQITGSLLVFALLVLPAATAQRLVARPMRSGLLAVAIAVTVTWLGLAVAYFTPYPIGFWITSLAFAAYLGSFAVPATAGTLRAHGRAASTAAGATTTLGPA